MTYYKIVVAYDGTGYHGWQVQPGATTISDVLIDSFSSVFFQKISILGASALMLVFMLWGRWPLSAHP